MKTTAVLSALAGASAVSAHTIFTQLKSGSTTYPVSYGIRTPVYDGPITDVSTNDVACNGGPNPTTPSDKIIDVQAGSTVTAIWRHTLTSGPSDVMDASHKGPTMAYLKKVSNALTDTGIGGGWFKIQEDGYNGGNWGTSKVITNGGNHAITIPSCIAPGQYLLRAEMLALHGASSPGGAQFYMECAQINVIGGTGTANPATVSFPGAYKSSDPGVTVNIYSNLASYTIPGPRPFTCSGSPPSSPPPSTPPPTTPPPTSNPPPTTPPPTSNPPPTTPPPSTPPPSGCAAMYGQCGGTGFSGPKCCSSGTCKASNEWYSQCL